jgi:hypothetical protein
LNTTTNAYDVSLNEETCGYGSVVIPSTYNGVPVTRIADDGFDKAYSEAFKLGELTERDLIKEINRIKSDKLDKNDDRDASDTSKDTREREINAWARRRTNLCRAYTAMVNTAASFQVRLAVKACRKVIKAQAKRGTSDNSSATFGVESDFSAVMAEIL